MVKLSKKKLLSAVLGAALSCAFGTVDAAVLYNPDPPGSVMAETGEASYIVTELVITGNKRHTEEEIKRLVPEATRPLVRPGQLSRQLSLLNDGQVMRIESSFTPIADQEYRLTLFVEEVKNDKFAISFNNTGNKFTGDYRASLSWMNTDITKHGDALGIAYTTSPDEHFSDVKLFGLTYKTIFPNSGDSMFFAYIYSDVNMGKIATFPGTGVSLEATGKGHTVSLHYQRNLLFRRARRQILDFGFDYKKYDNALNWIGMLAPGMGIKYNVGTFSATYYDVTRHDRDVFSWNLGWTTNLIGNSADYDIVRPGSDKSFHIFRTGAAYQYRTESDWLIGLSAYAQWTPNDLVQTEQLGWVGNGSVRGFKERVATGDKGAGGSLEIYTPQFIPGSRFVLFLDGAFLDNNTYNPGERSRRLASFGLGYRFSSERLGLYASLDYAKPISYGGLEGATRPWTFTLTKTF